MRDARTLARSNAARRSVGADRKAMRTPDGLRGTAIARIASAMVGLAIVRTAAKPPATTIAPYSAGRIPEGHGEAATTATGKWGLLNGDRARKMPRHDRPDLSRLARPGPGET